MLTDFFPCVAPFGLDPDIAGVERVKAIISRIRRRQRDISLAESGRLNVEALEVHGRLPCQAAVPGEADPVVSAVILADSDLLAGIVRIDNIDVSSIPIEVRRAKDPDQVRLQHTGSDIVSDKLTVNTPCCAISAVIAILAEGNTGIIHPDNVCSGFLVRRIHDQDFIRRAVIVGVVHYDISAHLAGDLLRHCTRRIRQGRRRTVCLVSCFLNAGNRAGDRCTDGSKFYFAISISQDVPARPNTFR